MEYYQYKAFISYSHKDRKWTRWLHRRLETYPIPKNIIGNVTSAGTIPRRLKPIFRDREELSASNNLGEKIEAALASSKNLIIICSPAAAQSKWVNQEILTFKRNNRDAQLFSVIVEGEPYASSMPGREDEECFPPALRFEVNSDGTLSDTPAEPLAADLRPHADGKRLGFLKLISGMIGVGLDEVVQRDMKRSRKRVTVITTASLATVLAMGTLTGFALDARAEAEQRRNDAEGLVDFMITDLWDKIEPLGRLDTLSDVPSEVLSYYNKYETKSQMCDESGRHARALHLAASKSYDGGLTNDFIKYSDSAYEITKKRLTRCDDDISTRVDHATSLYYVGIRQMNNGNRVKYNNYLTERRKLIDEYCERLPGKDDCYVNKAYIAIELGYQELSDKSGDLVSADSYFEEAVTNYKKTSDYKASEFKLMKDHAAAVGWRGEVSYKSKDFVKAETQYRVESRLLEDVLNTRKAAIENSEIQIQTIIADANSRLIKSLIMSKKFFEAQKLANDLSKEIDNLIEINPSHRILYTLKVRIFLLLAAIELKNNNSEVACDYTNKALVYQNNNNLTNTEFNETLGALELKNTDLCSKKGNKHEK